MKIPHLKFYNMADVVLCCCEMFREYITLDGRSHMGGFIELSHFTRFCGTSRQGTVKHSRESRFVHSSVLVKANFHFARRSTNRRSTVHS